jgi:hypothetical protein
MVAPKQTAQTVYLDPKQGGGEASVDASVRLRALVADNKVEGSGEPVSARALVMSRRSGSPRAAI